MTLKATEITQFLLALTALLVMAHLCGHLFKKLRQPPVIGEIVGGLLLGPTVLGQLLPDVQQWIFDVDGASSHVLAAFYQLGLLLLVYLIGVELRGHRPDGDSRTHRTIVSITLLGLILPFAAGVSLFALVSLDDLAGPAGSSVTLSLVFGMAVAITSIPVISRIMLDLGIMKTRFARIVLSASVVEDLLLYIVLAAILGIAQAQQSQPQGLLGLLEIHSTGASVVYFTLVPAVFLAAFLWAGPRLFAHLSGNRLNVVETRSPVAFRIAFLFALCLTCVFLGIDAIFGALVAGLCAAGPAGHRAQAAHDGIRDISLAFFVPVYFAIVGLKLDLVRHFDPVFFAWFAATAVAVKWGSVWLGARLAGEDRTVAVNLAMAMNARGGPGIVLASTAFAAGIINESFFTSLVILSILTSQLAGIWLERAVRRRAFATELLTDAPTRPDPDPAAPTGARSTPWSAAPPEPRSTP